jgi:hypothetical protein
MLMWQDSCRGLAGSPQTMLVGSETCTRDVPLQTTRFRLGSVAGSALQRFPVERNRAILLILRWNDRNIRDDEKVGLHSD